MKKLIILLLITPSAFGVTFSKMPELTWDAVTECSDPSTLPDGSPCQYINVYCDGDFSAADWEPMARLNPTDTAYPLANLSVGAHQCAITLQLENFNESGYSETVNFIYNPAVVVPIPANLKIGAKQN